MTRILVIENQQTQYERIKKYLDAREYTVMPSDEEYIDFIDNVKIYINPRYEGVKKQNAWKSIEGKVDEADLLLIDHKLSGTHIGKTGIGLAVDIVWKIGNFPILFFSRTDKGERSVKDELEKLQGIEGKDWIWVDKGYSGESLFNEGYFKEYVVKGIESLDFYSLGKLVERVEKIGVPSCREKKKYFSCLEQIRGKKWIGKTKRDLIHLLKKQEENVASNKENLKKFISEYDEICRQMELD